MARVAGTHRQPDLPTRDARLPLAGAVLERCYRGRVIQVKVLLDGFEHEGQRFACLSAIAERVTGTRWNGFLFFGLQARNACRLARRL